MELKVKYFECDLSNDRVDSNIGTRAVTLGSEQECMRYCNELLTQDYFIRERTWSEISDKNYLNWEDRYAIILLEVQVDGEIVLEKQVDEEILILVCEEKLEEYHEC